MHKEVWQGCYDGGWKGVIVEDAFAHPAKYARGLIQRIYRHLLESKYIEVGATVVDPFGGVGLGALDAMANGLHWVGCELEPRFVSLGNRNIDKWNRQFAHSAGWGTARLLQGDSRRLCEVVGPVLAEVVCASPPFQESVSHHVDDNELQPRIGDVRKHVRTMTHSIGYGQTPGQLGAMPSGDVDAVLASPPYAVVSPESNGPGIDRRKQWETYRASGGGSSFEAFSAQQAKHSQGYGTAPGNIANLPAGSVADAVVSSPPYERSMDTTEQHDKRADRTGGFTQGMRDTKYGQNPFTFLSKDPSGLSNDARKALAAKNPQVGALDGNTFWAAAKIIAQQSFAILKPGGVAVWVTKDFVRNKKRVQFSDDWRKLCEACGFELVKWIKASLVKEWDEATLFNGTERKVKERKSFFRRLAEKKGSPRIDHEDFLIMRKAAP